MLEAGLVEENGERPSLQQRLLRPLRGPDERRPVERLELACLDCPGSHTWLRVQRRPLNGRT